MMDMQAGDVAINMTIQVTRACNGVTEEFNIKLTAAEESRSPVVHDVVGAIDAQPAGMLNQ
jgi:hypothetical protein